MLPGFCSLEGLARGGKNRTQSFQTILKGLSQRRDPFALRMIQLVKTPHSVDKLAYNRLDLFVNRSYRPPAEFQSNIDDIDRGTLNARQMGGCFSA